VACGTDCFNGGLLKLDSRSPRLIPFRGVAAASPFYGVLL
jgi:hypothetical protein